MCIRDSTYTDTVSGAKFTVANGVLTGNLGSTGVAVVYNGTTTPRNTCSVESGDFKGDTLTPVSYTHLDVYKRQQVSGVFSQLQSNPIEMVIWMAIITILGFLVCSRGFFQELSPVLFHSLLPYKRVLVCFRLYLSTINILFLQPNPALFNQYGDDCIKIKVDAFNHMIGSKAVSYTHLDVYKRQTYECCSSTSHEGSEK